MYFPAPSFSAIEVTSPAYKEGGLKRESGLSYAFVKRVGVVEVVLVAHFDEVSNSYFINIKKY